MSKKREVEIPKIQRRTLTFDRAGINVEDRTVPIAFSSELPVERYFGNEILDHSPQSVDLSRLNNGGAVLVSHNPDDQVGVVVKASIDSDRKGRALIRFGKSQRASEIFQDVQDGIRSLVSVGYEIRKMVLEKTDGGLETFRATSWQPFELSFVSIPADPSVGVGRSNPTPEENNMKIRVLLDADPANGGTGGSLPAAPAKPAAQTIDINHERERIRKEEQTRVAEVTKLCRQHNAPQEVIDQAQAGLSIDETRALILEKVIGARKVENPNPNIGMSQKDLRSYSLVRAIRAMVEDRKLDGLEKEASDAVAKMSGRAAKGFYIPHDISDVSLARAHQMSQRSLLTATSSAGGFTVETELLGSSMIELLRNKTKVIRMGARSLSGLVGNVVIPKATGAATAYWLAENASVTETDQTFGQLGLVPHRLVADTAFSKDLLAQSSIDIEGFVRDDIMKVLALEKDRAAINGSGVSGQPLGILNTSGLSTSITFGTAATWAKMVQFESNIATSNADDGKLGYMTTPATRGKLKTAPKATNYPTFIWENGAIPSEGLINGYLAAATNQVPSDRVIFGNWDDLIIADWSGMDVVVDPYSLKKQSLIEVTVTLWTDIGVRHPVSFCVSTDSGAQ